jgi:hypothetical protein
MAFLNNQIKTFLSSFMIANPIKSILLSFAKNISLSVFALLFLAGLYWLLGQLVPFIDIVDSMKSYGENVPQEIITQFLDNKHLFIEFMVNLIIITIVLLIIYLLLMAVFDSLIIKALKKEHWNLKYFKSLLKVYAFYSLIATILFGIFVFFIQVVLIFYAVSILLAIIYIYIMLMSAVTTKEDKFMKNIKNSLKYSIKIQHTIIPIIISLLVGLILLGLCLASALLIEVYMWILVYILFSAYPVWVFNYFRKIYAISH